MCALSGIIALKQANDYEEILLNKLPESDKVIYTEMMSNRATSYSEEVNQSFTDGFTLGALFLLEYAIMVFDGTMQGYLDRVDGIGQSQLKNYTEHLSERYPRNIVEDITKEILMYE